MSIQAWWKRMTAAERIGVIFRAITTVASVSGAVVCVHEVRKAHETVEYATSKIGDSLVDVEVSDQLVSEAVDRAARAQVRRVVQESVQETAGDIREQTKKEVETAVEDARKQIAESVSARMAEECKKLNGADILKDIKEQAAEKLSEKLDEKLDDITDEYAKNLSNMGRVYEALADKLQSKA